MSEFKIITVCTHFPTADYYTLNEYVKSLRGHKPFVMDGSFYHYSGLGSKIKMAYKAIKDGYVKEKYILFTDCFDMFFAADPQKLIDKYKDVYSGYLVFGAEKNCFPPDLKDEYDKLPYISSYRYPNTGMICGETEMFLELLESMNPYEIPDDYRNEDGSMTHINDQQLYMVEILKQKVPMVLDHAQILVQNLHMTTIDDFDLTGENIINKETGESPLLYHCNGSAKDSGVKEPILEYLKLS